MRLAAGVRSVLLVALALCSSVACAGSALLDAVGARVQSAPVLRGQFTQERELAGFSRSLRSSGHFVAVRDKGVIWTTEQPFPAELTISADAIRERVEGRRQTILDATREPALRQINDILLSLLQGDVERLQAQFAVDGSIDDQGWNLQLSPQAQMASLIGQISLSGNQQIERVEIRESGGDVSRIHFSGLLRHPPELSADEMAAFD